MRAGTPTDGDDASDDASDSTAGADVESMKAVDESFRSDFGAKLGGEVSAAMEHNPALKMIRRSPMPRRTNGAVHSQTPALTLPRAQRSPASASSVEAMVPGPGHLTLNRMQLSSTGMCAPRP